MRQLPEFLRDTVQELLATSGSEIAGPLEDYLDRVKRGAYAGRAILGRAAEFLAAQRGIER